MGPAAMQLLVADAGPRPQATGPGSHDPRSERQESSACYMIGKTHARAAAGAVRAKPICVIQAFRHAAALRRKSRRAHSLRV